MKKKKLKIQRGLHYDENTFRLDLSNLEFNTMVKCATVQMANSNFKDWEVVGRLVQVRKKMAVDGSDLFFIRRCDGSLYSFYNDGVHVLKPDALEYLNGFFTDEPDEPNKEYGIDKKRNSKRIGFIITE